MVKKILITGSNGFVGKNLVEYYTNKYDIITLSKNDNLDDRLSEKPDYIINAAAKIYDNDHMFETNVLLVDKLIKYVKETNARLIQIGSSAEYGKKHQPTKETDSLEPMTYYAGTKAAATLMCLSASIEHKLPILVARPYSLYGKYEKPYRLFSKLYDAFTKHTEMTLWDGYHDFIYIDDFIVGLDSVLHSDNYGEVINFGTGTQTSNFEVLDIFIDIFGYSPSCISINCGFAKFFENNTWICDTQYSKTKYKFNPKFSIREGIIDLIKQRNKYDY